MEVVNVTEPQLSGAKHRLPPCYIKSNKSNQDSISIKRWCPVASLWAGTSSKGSQALGATVAHNTVSQSQKCFRIRVHKEVFSKARFHQISINFHQNWVQISKGFLVFVFVFSSRHYRARVMAAFWWSYVDNSMNFFNPVFYRLGPKYIMHLQETFVWARNGISHFFFFNWCSSKRSTRNTSEGTTPFLTYLHHHNKIPVFILN